MTSERLRDRHGFVGHGFIVVSGACEHNLKNVSLSLPKNQLVVISGLSGSGKSSLAFDTLYAEGQRRYVESLSAYARQFLEIMKKPDVQSISGLCPAISIEQKTTSKNPRSTVGTVTEIYDYLRVLFARVGVPHSPATGLPIEAQTRVQMVERILAHSGTDIPQKVTIFAPIVRKRKGEFREEFLDLRRKGYRYVQVNGLVTTLDDIPILDRNKRHDISVLVDRITIKEISEDMIARLSAGLESALDLADGFALAECADEKSILLSSRFCCPLSGFTPGEIEPRLFSFNSPVGACSSCGGLGTEAGEMDVGLGQNFPCRVCGGKRLCLEALSIKIAGYNIASVCDQTITQLLAWCTETYEGLRPAQKNIAERIFKEITSRLSFLIQVGLGYLTLSRRSASLSGGEGQRIRLASQIGSGLTGVMYVLDEPSIGLHQRDNERLLETLFQLRDLGNSVIVVEHDEDTIRAADYLVDMGPGAGHHGGHVVAAGSLEDIIAEKKSLTGAYLRRERAITISRRRNTLGNAIRIVGACANNLRNVDVDIPLGTITCVTGVSGSGKSSLVMETLYPLLFAAKNKRPLPDGLCLRIDGCGYIDKIIDISQDAIGRTPHSNPATYTGVFTPIREWFAGLSEARARGYTAGRFSFNVPGGRCEACHGQGALTISMHFLPDVSVTCEACGGKRFSSETLDIKYKGHSISDVLDLSVEQAADLFSAVPSIANKLNVLKRVGLGYITLGQKATTLSGGEAQRVKLSKELSGRSTGRTLYILDEPTTGLHFEDVRQLLHVLQQLVSRGNTVVVIEHNLDVIKCADWVIDLGPEGGDAGGYIVGAGIPEHIATIEESHTGAFLKRVLAVSSVAA